MVERDYSELERQLRETQQAYSSLSDTYDELMKRCAELEEQVSLSGLTPQQIKYIVLCANTRSNARSVDVAGADGRVKKDQIDFDNWERMVTRSLNSRVEALEKEAGALRGSYFSMKMHKIIESDPRYGKVGFVYYDFFNGKTIYTPGLLELFGMDEKDASDKELSLRSFISHINRENRYEVLDALRKGKSLENYNTKTRDGLRKLTVNAFPLVYDNKSVGIAVFINDPTVDFDRRGALRFAGSIRRAIKNVSNEFQVIREYSRKKKETNSLETQFSEEDFLEIQEDVDDTCSEEKV